jgi:uncharacterized protein (TIGR02145 family)
MGWTTLVLIVGTAAALALQPAFRIAPAYEGVREFALAVRKNPADRDTLYQRLVLDAHSDACAGSMGSFTHLPSDILPGEALDIVRRIEEGRVRDLVESGLQRASAALPGAERTTVCIQAVALNRAMEHMRGVGGVSLGGRIKIFVHPTIAGFARVEYTAAHEYHHEVARLALAPGWSSNPLEAIIAEGKADTFAVRLFPVLRPPHTDPLTPDERRRSWEALQRQLSAPSEKFREDFMFGLAEGMPRWAGYRLGFEMVNEYLEAHPDLSAQAWTRLPAREFLEEFSHRGNPGVRQMADGRQWTTINLNVNTRESYCYADSDENCRRYGRLYTWESAQRGCQFLGDGWRLPANDDWRQMAKHYGGVRDDSDDSGKSAYAALLIGGSSGFDAVLAGNRSEEGEYARLGAHGLYWTASESDANSAWFYNFGKGGSALNRHSGGSKKLALSVRCVRDAHLAKSVPPGRS